MTTKITAVGYPATLDLAGLIALAISRPYRTQAKDGATAEINRVGEDFILTIRISGMLSWLEIAKINAQIQADPHVARLISGFPEPDLCSAVFDAVVCKSALAEVSDAPKITTGFDPQENRYFAEARWANTGIPRDLVRATRFGETLAEAAAKLSRDFGIEVVA